MRRGLVRSLVPEGFELMSHPAFATFESNITVKRDLIDLKIDPQLDVNTTSGESDDVSVSRCPICLMSHILPVTLTACSHSFCEVCILQWLKLNTVCPLCKSPVCYFLKGEYQQTLRLYEIQDGQGHEDICDEKLLKVVNLHIALRAQDKVSLAGCKRKADDGQAGPGIPVENSTDDTTCSKPLDYTFDPERFNDGVFHCDYECSDSSGEFTGRLSSLDTEGSYLEFKIHDNQQDIIGRDIVIFDILHVFVPKKHRGKRVAEALVLKVVDIVRSIPTCVIRPTCSYVRDTFLNRNTDLHAVFEEKLHDE